MSTDSKAPQYVIDFPMAKDCHFEAEAEADEEAKISAGIPQRFHQESIITTLEVNWLQGMPITSQIFYSPQPMLRTNLLAISGLSNSVDIQRKKGLPQQ
ncbi:hypothetical protein CANMA_002547 [Candida margitis]|uniref:uncharacterized protein n=1 Tax=Candida margitis TaxID=1775924 RepID=UPI00222616C7|nr:uncharacterized protein CANMA_002547 [Candida margitis]KAI5968331.1 hypothetical protein CANMA_002547 [Candida margitis]